MTNQRKKKKTKTGRKVAFEIISRGFVLYCFFVFRFQKSIRTKVCRRYIHTKLGLSRFRPAKLKYRTAYILFKDRQCARVRTFPPNSRAHKSRPQRRGRVSGDVVRTVRGDGGYGFFVVFTRPPNRQG